MNQYFPDWSSAMGDTFAPLGSGAGEDDGLIELMWCNGHVVMQSQALRKPPRPDKAAAAAAVQDDDASAAWFQYPVEDPLERDLFSELFGEAQAAVDGGRACKEEAAERGGDAPAHHQTRMMPPPLPRPAQAPREKACAPDSGVAAARSSGCEDTETATATATEGGESSMLTIGSSFCGSNHVQTPRARGAVPCDDGATPPPGSGKDVARARDAVTVTSSSMRSRSCTTKSDKPGSGAAAAAHRSSGKRKQSDATKTEDVEFESADVTCEPAQKMTTAKRRRAAEVHNLSERRRRDRINEKMKALQELIPNCNKTDKASMLDEAIEYLKSLQLQLQMMWMGGGMAAAAPAVMFPAGVHQYMPRMVAPPHVASMPGLPFMAPPPTVQGPPVPDLYARYLAVDHPPPPPMVAPPPYTCPQGMGFYPRQNPVPPPPPPPPPPAAVPSDGILHKKYENCGKPEIKSMTS